MMRAGADREKHCGSCGVEPNNHDFLGETELLPRSESMLKLRRQFPDSASASAARRSMVWIFACILVFAVWLAVTYR